MLCCIFQREKNKLRTIHGTTDAVGVGAAARAAEKFTAIFLALLPNKIWLQKNTFSSLLFQLHVK